MARRTVVTLEDDVGGGPADVTLRFGIDGAEYEIDLNEKNAARFRNQIAPFIEHARRAGRRSRRAVRTAASRQRSREIRAWAKRRGIELSERGRIPADVVAQFDAASRKTSRRLRVQHLRTARSAEPLLCIWRQRGFGAAPGKAAGSVHDQWWAAANWSASVDPASAVVDASGLTAEVTRSK
jgi:hypothetical protein